MTQLSAQTFVPFDAPGAGTTANQGTIPSSINQGGAIAGYYFDSSGVNHSFVRSAAGVVTEFDPAGSTGSAAIAINRSGQIAGESKQAYLRNTDGTFVNFSPSRSTNTLVAGINDAGAIAGSFTRSDNAWYGYVRHPDGSFSIFSVPNSGHGPGQGTMVFGINAKGEVTGYYNDKAGYAHGFFRDAHGNITSFDPPGSDFTQPVAINFNGQVVGYYTYNQTYGFVRDAAGNFTSFQAPGAISTFPYAMNDQGSVVGKWRSQEYVDLAFELQPGLGISEFSALSPDSTTAIAINNGGQITGYYVDASGVYHGWVRSK